MSYHKTSSSCDNTFIYATYLFVYTVSKDLKLEFNKSSTLGLLLMHYLFSISLLLPYKISTENINANILGTD